MSSSVSDRRANEQYHIPHLTYASPPPTRPSLPQQYSQTRAGPSYETHNSSVEPLQQRPSRLRRLRPWSFSSRASGSGCSSSSPGISGKAKPDTSTDADLARALQSYEELRIAEPNSKPRPQRPQISTRQKDVKKWPESDDDGTDNELDGYSWVDPSNVEIDRSSITPIPRRMSFCDAPSPITTSQVIMTASRQPIRIPESPKTKPKRPGMLNPTESYNLLLAYQSSSGHSSGSHASHASHASHGTPPTPSPFASVDAVCSGNTDPEWHDLVDPSIRETLGKQEVRRQGLWWELIKGEVEYVRDLRMICKDIIEPMRQQQPPLLTPEHRLQAFVTEVFSTIPDIHALHEQLLSRLLERQRSEWPLVTSATDIMLRTYLEAVDLYEVYMKNFPFAEARVKREVRDNPAFATFLNDRNTLELTNRRDMSVLLSRPVSRLPRILLLLEAILLATPEDHPDREEIPTIRSVLQGAIKSTQPGIASAEAKIDLWNVGEKLLFRKGEIVEVDIPDPKRMFFHAGYVFRRVRSETNWHGWQDLKAILLDNYFLLTREEEQGRLIVVSRPIHIDFLELTRADGDPERRHDYINQVRRRQSGGLRDGLAASERLMYPFTITHKSGPNPKVYTLCVATPGARDKWREKIENAKAIRRYDVESNRAYAIHTIYIPRDINVPKTADTFTWLGRETVAVAAGKSVWIGWRRDSHSYRELIRLPGIPNQAVSTITVIPDFGWLLVVVGGSLIAFNLRDIIPTHAPETWIKTTRAQGIELTPPDQDVAFVRVGTTKGRLLVVHASYLSRALPTGQTILTFEEPLHASTSDLRLPKSAFRRFAQLVVPGFASDVGFFRQTIAIVTEKTFIVAEPGNSNYNTIPVLPSSISPSATVARMTSQAKPMAMYQIAEKEFLLAYDWGACFATRYGEISRNGSFMRWNLTPSYMVYRAPHLLLFDEEGGRAEVRHASTGKVMEVVEWRGMKPLRLCRPDQGVLAVSPNGLVEVVETVPL